MKNDEPTFGAMLKKMRMEKGVSLSEVARAVNVSAAFLSDVELHRRQPPAYEMLVAIMDCLEVQAEDRYLYYDAALEERCSVCKYKCPERERDYGKAKEKPDRKIRAVGAKKVGAGDF